MTLNELIKIVKGNTNINSDEKINSIKTDSRLIEKGDIFIALNGDKYDGNDYIFEAIKKGAIACITNKYLNELCIIVNNTYESLYLISNYIRNKHNIPLIAITGSNGKTTTKELLYHILSCKYNVLKNEDSKNNIIGISHTLFELSNNHNLIVLEMGSNHMGEIELLSRMCEPNLSIITNIGSSHLGYFKTKKNIFKEKYSIIKGMKDKKIIVNGDDKYLKKLKCFKCGINNNNDLIAYDIEEYIDKVIFKINLDKEYKIVFNNPGIHFINDILLVIKVCIDFNISIEDIISRISTFKLIHNRMNIFNVNNNVIIDDSYNSSYESLKCGIEYLKNIDKDKILIIGDILELGIYSKHMHKKINKFLSKFKDYKIFTVGKYSKNIKGINFNDVDELITFWNKDLDDVCIYIKGSRKINLDRFVKYIKDDIIY